MNTVHIADRQRFARMTTDELRESFLVTDLFAPGELRLTLTDLDRAIVGGAMPTSAPLVLPCPAELRAVHFCDRRELGVLNLGGSGSVTVDGEVYPLSRQDVLYIGRGAQQVEFAAADEDVPAAFYLLSYPAHAAYPTTLMRFADMQPITLGSAESCNARTIYKAIHSAGARSCQLVMGFTLLEPGSNWNTMPPHTHSRRTEIYMYFDVQPEARVFHLVGPPDATRHIVVADREVALSPGWSVHSGVGTRNYGFCWGMGGENQDYADMDPVSVPDLR